MIRRRRMLLNSGNKYVYYEDITTFKENGNFTVPTGSVELEAFIVGGGGGGAVPTGVRTSYKAGAKGLGGVVLYQSNIPFTDGQVFAVTVGSAGVGATKEGVAGTNGGASSFGSYTAAGGNGGSSTAVTSSTVGTDGVTCPIENVDGIASGSLFGASGADGSTTATALAGGTTGGGKGASKEANAEAGSFYGAGGGGGEVYKSYFTTTVRNAGDGYQGIVIVKAVVKYKESDLITDYDVITSTTQTVYIIPSGTIKLDVFIVGGGGGGLSPKTNDITLAKGGQTVYVPNVSFTTGERVSIRVGKGGSKVKYNSKDDVGFAAGNGGNTYFGEFTAKGGVGAKNIASDYTNEVVDGVSCPFGENIAFKDASTPEATTLLPKYKYGACGGFNSHVSNPPTKMGGVTGGGYCNVSDLPEWLSSSKYEFYDGTFYGAGGSSCHVSYQWHGDGYKGIIIIRRRHL